MSRWIAPGVVGVRGGRIHAPIPQWHEHLSVSGGGGRGRGHFDRVGFRVCERSSGIDCGFSSGCLRVVHVLAARDQAWWDLGLLDVGGGRERPDARRGAVWRAVPLGGSFCK